MAVHETRPAASAAPKILIQDLDEATIRFAGDASDAMQLIGTQFTHASTSAGNVVCTLPDVPAEIRAPTGTLAGVAGFQIHFSKRVIHTPGDCVNTLVAMNPAALQSNLADVVEGGIVIVDADAFSPMECHKAGYTDDPLEDGTLDRFHLVSLPLSQLNRDAVARVNLIPREAERCRGFFALGLAFWLYERSPEPTLRWLRDIYAKNPAMLEAATRSLKMGCQHAELCGEFPVRYRVAKAPLPDGRYRQITGNEAMALGVLTAAHQANLPLVFASFPVQPANELLHRLTEWKQDDATIIQAEDDLAAINMALGASFGGALGVTAVTGPGLSLQAETLGLAVMSELPCVIIDVQRAGPSTGMPSKTEQSDLLAALHGRHGECPLIVLAPATPGDGFAIMLEAAKLAIRFMTPVIVLADADLAQCAETWRVPDLKSLAVIEAPHATPSASFQPYQRDVRLARPWAIPGTPGLEHRIGGMEKEHDSGNVSYDPANHQRMIETRAQKVAGAAADVPDLVIEGPAKADLLVLGWGSTYDVISVAAEHCRKKGKKVANAHLRHLWPMPKNVGAVLKRYRRILVPEMNSGQLAQVLRSQFQAEIVSLSKVQGRPFWVNEVERKIEELIAS